MEFAIRWIGDKKRGKSWWQECRATGELEKVIKSPVTSGMGRKCGNADRLF
jgi:hypothetical protein